MSQSFPPPGPPGPPAGPPAGPTPELPSAEPPRNRGKVIAGVLVAVVVLAVVVTGFLTMLGDDGEDPVATIEPTDQPSTSAPASPSALPSTDPRLTRFYEQKLDWSSCGSDECAKLTVPLDYANPADGATVDLAVLKVPAKDKSERVGALVVNPGGPGGSGVDYAKGGSLQFGSALADHFDIVGFDPRGVGESDPLKCVSTSQLDRLLAFDPDPDDLAERNEMDRLIRRFGQGCLDESGALARHMSTVEVAKDLDILRAALGQARLDYFGASYGTLIGATYADLFPTHVGRFVLDGAVDPALSQLQLSLQQAHGFETALRAYVKDCVDDGGCILGSSVDAGVERIQRFLAEVAKDPLPTSDDSRPLTDGLAVMGIWLPLYAKRFWPVLTEALKQAFEEHRGTNLLVLADAYSSRGPDGYTDNSMEALYAVNCLDHDDYIPTSQVPAHFAQFEKASPTFGRVFAFSLSSCANWPVKSGKHTVALHAKGAPPIVVIGTTRDPATPLAWAQALARELDSGRLITRDGDGHTGFQSGNDCVDNAVENWLIQGKVPRNDLGC